VQHALARQVQEEAGVDRRDAAEHPGEAGPLRGDRRRRGADHRRVDGPVLVDVEIPVREVVRLVPELDGLDHARPPASAQRTCTGRPNRIARPAASAFLSPNNGLSTPPVTHVYAARTVTDRVTSTSSPKSTMNASPVTLSPSSARISSPRRGCT